MSRPVSGKTKTTSKNDETAAQRRDVGNDDEEEKEERDFVSNQAAVHGFSKGNKS